MSRIVIFDFFGVIHENPLTFIEEHIDSPLKQKELDAICTQLDIGLITYNQYVHAISNLTGLPSENLIQIFEGAKLNKRLVTYITNLGKRTKIILLSNTSAQEIMPLFEKHSLRQLFDHVIISSVVGMAKPDPAIFNHTCEVASASPKDCVFIDDTSANVVAAQSLGMHGIVHKLTARTINELEAIGV